ncbi:MAG: D-aminoacylase, partial [Acidimicrobiales bacterium]
MASCAPFVVRGARIVDGSGGPPTRGDLRVGADGRVAAVGPSLSPAEGEAVVDGAGLALSPGFVDLHSHSDLYALQRTGTAAPVGDAPKLLQGCTAQVFGQDGVSAAPVADGDRADFAASIAGLDGTIGEAAWTWRSFGEYL